MRDGWTTGSAAAVNLSESKLSALDDSLRAGVFQDVTSVLIARRGMLVHEVYAKGDEATLRNTRSVSKTITGMLVGIAIDRGHLSSAEDKVLPYLSQAPIQNPDPRKSEITLADFMTMSSVLECNDWSQASVGNEETMYLREDWLQFVLDLPIKGAPPWETPPAERLNGRHFTYCTGGVYALGRVLESASGQTVGDFAQANLFDPLGISSLEWARTPLGNYQTGGGLDLRSRDLLKLGQLYANGGTWNGTRLVSQSWVNASMQRHSEYPDPRGSDLMYGFGYLWWMRPYSAQGTDTPVQYMAGTGGNMVAVVPEYDLVVVITSENYRVFNSPEISASILTDYVLGALVK